jgi:hypothetical protein
MKATLISSFLLGGILTGLSQASPSLKSTTKCPIILDGRIPKNTTLSTLDTSSSPFSPTYTKGRNLTWSQIIKYPLTCPSKFDSITSKPLEVTISDASIFVSGGVNVQYGFRRAGLLLGNGSDATNSGGSKTFHFSVRQDMERKMNLTHEYMNVWHEANDYASNQWSLNAGVMLEQDWPKDKNISTSGLDRKLWKVLDRRNNVVWTTRILGEEWQNFGVRMDYEKK